MRIAVIGTGYVGLVTGACLAELGVQTWCVDKDPDKIDALRRGRLPIYEPHLDDVVIENHRAGRLHFTEDMGKAVAGAAVVFITVGTPETPDGDVDLSYVFAAAEEAARHVEGFTVFVTKSTVPVGTSRWVGRIVAETNPAAEIAVASNPEFLREGNAVFDFMRPDRVTFGASDRRALEVLRRLYRPLRLSGVPIVETNPETAELSKYAANGYLATKVAFINEVADLCEAVDADVGMVSRTLGLDSRIGPRHLSPGPGYGGSCFPKDTKAFARCGRAVGAPQTIVDAVIASNAARKARLCDRVRAALGGELAGMRVGVLGLTFKADTDDVREAPALTLLPALVQQGAEVCAYDPMGAANTMRLLGAADVTYLDSAEAVAREADCLVILTEWDEFRSLDVAALQALMRGRVIVDFRNLLDAEAVAALGFRYHGVGRRPFGVPAAPTELSVAAE